MTADPFKAWNLIPPAKTRMAEKIFALFFVDRKFTTLVERLFTNAFDVTGAYRAGACVYRAGNAD